ncbi:MULTISPECIES: hypothetical protein [unclassified Isoptericola]|uniref:hypothetical protein n=1 Tax=unclassified Isoptericola TaxID=2623355 RepID=UPI0027139C7F|nr:MULTISPECIES: hypothetical protein [unclassified Isoptericola]MDO8144181.1 hypothetical protein [Isoptericola sp. 178]MDO8148035.1 hypothetical protein [Isoptericola sp. b515]
MSRFELMLGSPVSRIVAIACAVWCVGVGVYVIGGTILRLFGREVGTLDLKQAASELHDGDVLMASMVARVKAPMALAFVAWIPLFLGVGVLGPRFDEHFREVFLWSSAAQFGLMLWAAVEFLWAWPGVLVAPEARGTSGYLQSRRSRSRAPKGGADDDS